MNADRHQTVEIRCELCGTPHLARVERVNKGQGRFCSLKCANEWQREQNKSLYGKEKGKKYWEKKRGEWKAHWYDESGKIHVQQYARWWWEVNIGVVPNGYNIAYKDGDYSNLDPSNFECIPMGVAHARGGHKTLGIPKPSMQGENSRWWTGGRSYEYSLRFSKSLKRKVKTRDNYTCRCCDMEFTTHRLDVHHIDWNKENNLETNLVTVCKSCHRAIHGKENKINGRILYYRGLLLAD